MNFSHVMVNMSRLQGGKSFLSIIALLCDTILEASSEDVSRYLQGLALCLVVDFTASAPRTEGNELHFSQGLKLLTETMKKTVYFDNQILEECLEAATMYLSSPIIYIDPQSDKFKDLIRYFLAELQDACIGAPQRAALLVDKILACYLDIRPSVSNCSNTNNENRFEAWVLMLLSFSRTCLKHNILSTDRLVYIKEILVTVKSTLDCSILLNYMNRFIIAVPSCHNTFSTNRRNKLLKILKILLHLKRKSRRNRRTCTDTSLCNFPTSGLLPFTHPCCALPHFQESFDNSKYRSNIVHVVTRINLTQTYFLQQTTSINKSFTIIVQCENIPRFMTEQAFYSVFTEWFSLDSLLSVNICKYLMTDTLTHTALLCLSPSTNADDTDSSEKLAMFNNTIKHLIDSPELIVWGHAMKLIIYTNLTDYNIRQRISLHVLNMSTPHPGIVRNKTVVLSSPRDKRTFKSSPLKRL